MSEAKPTDPADKAADSQFQPKEAEIDRLIRYAKAGKALYAGEGARIVEHYERLLEEKA